MSRFYIRWLNDEGKPDPSYDPVGPYPSKKMAEAMSGTYEALFQRKGEVVQIDD